MTSPAEMLADAKQLDSSGKSDARRRTIISRAYYAAYHFLNDHPCSQAFQSGQNAGVGMHRQFFSYLQGESDRSVSYAGRRLETLYSWRIKADYRLNTPIPHQQTTDCISDAEEIIEDLLAAYGDAHSDESSE